MSRFYHLTVTDIHHTIRDAVVLTLEPENPEAFGFTQGQYLTFKQDFDGTELRRNYSICAGLDDGKLQVGIKRVDGGAFSTFANTQLKVGDRLQAMPPQGKFHTAIEPDRAKNYLGFAGGSGITPVLGIMRHVLATDPAARFTLVYANRKASTIMFRDEIEDLKNRHLGRVSVVHVLEHDAQEIDLFTGRVTPEKCADLFARWIDVGSVDRAYICGPEPMMRGIAQALRDHGLPDDRIRFELFASAQPGRLAQAARPAAAAPEAVPLSVTLEGTTVTVEIAPGESVLEAALAAGLDAPWSCRAGVCSTCRCKVVKGSVEMAANHAIEDDEAAKGFVLSCQSYPMEGPVAVDYDAAH